jgi:predicted tellurium resistance membrane protein TerC
MEWIFSTEGIVSLLTLTFLEIVLGIDNVVFISITSGRLPSHLQARARIIGTLLALVARIGLLLGVSWIISLTLPFLTFRNFSLSFRDLILLAGGLFLIGKSVSEIHAKLEGGEEQQHQSKALSLRGAIIQIILLDLIFSFDSILTAVGIVENVTIIIIAIVISLAIMLAFSGKLSDFLNRHPAMKLLAVACFFFLGPLIFFYGFYSQN